MLTYWYLSGKIRSYKDCNEYSVNYDYSYAYGRPTDINVTSPAGALIYDVNYVYDQAGRLTDVCEPLLGSNTSIAGFEYDDNGNRSKLKYYLDGSKGGDTVSIDYTYNACECQCDNHLTAFTTSGVEGLDFSFDATESGNIDGLGRLRSCSETLTKVGGVQASHTCTYNYDMLSRLTYAKITDVAPKPYMQWSNTYDNASNMTNFIYNEGGNDVSTTYSFNGDLVTGDNTGKSVDWDNNGRQTSRLNAAPADYAIIYNWEGRLQQAKLGSANRRIEAKYTPDGARVTKKKVWDGNTVYNHKYIVDITGKVPAVLLVLDANNNNAILKTYIHANGEVLAQHDGDHTADRYFYLHDRLGSVRQIIDDAGSVVNCYTYDPWGLPVGNETQETISNMYLFAGYVWDSEISQYHCYRRQYDPVLWRFTNRDPVTGNYEEPMSLHKYLYCGNDSINKTDPTGENYSGALQYAERSSARLSVFNRGTDFILDIMDSDADSWNIFDFAIGLNNVRQNNFSRADKYHLRSGDIKETAEHIISPEDARFVGWECGNTEGFYRHCVASCRLNKMTIPAFTMIAMLTGGGDWPWQWSGTNNLSDITADFAGIAASYVPFGDCRSLCKPMSKAASSLLCK
jgi:RHS repeat-associated protein